MPTTTSTTTTTPTTTTRPPTLEECLALIPIDVRVGQLLLPVVTPGELADVAALVASGHIAGVVVIGSPTDAIGERLADLQAMSLIGPSIVAVDEEGGRVQRTAALLGHLPSARTVASTLSVEDARELHRAHAVRLAELGFTMNLAPVLDLDIGGYIRDRSFSADPAVVSAYGLAVADGIRDAGLVPVVKHFPGHGRGTDSHTGLPTLPKIDVLRSSDLLPFIDAIGRGDVPVMIGHLVIPDVTGDEPASLSAAVVTELLRDELGFDGLVMTDALNMDAIAVARDGAAAAEAALHAGVDLAMLGRAADVEPTIARLLEAVDSGRLTERSVNESFVRVMSSRGIDPCDIPADEEPAIRCQGISTGGCALAGG